MLGLLKSLCWLWRLASKYIQLSCTVLTSCTWHAWSCRGDKLLYLWTQPPGNHKLSTQPYFWFMYENVWQALPFGRLASQHQLNAFKLKALRSHVRRHVHPYVNNKSLPFKIKVELYAWPEYNSFFLNGPDRIVLKYFIYDRLWPYNCKPPLLSDSPSFLWFYWYFILKNSHIRCV